jgi:hypothetical protein
VRPLDDGAQADFDGDGLGDECDPCPLNEGGTCMPINPNDRDGDGVEDLSDNCPAVANTEQADADGDGAGDVCDACAMQANPGGAPCVATIYEARDGTYDAGDTIRIQRSVVTAVGARGFAMQVPSDHADYDGVELSGIFVFTSDPPVIGTTPVTAGMTVDVVGDLTDFFGQPQLDFVTVTMSATAGAEVVPVETTAAALNTGGASANDLLNVLVRVVDVAVSDPTPAPTGTGGSTAEGEFEVDGVLRVDDFFYRIDPFVVDGEEFASITGVTLFASERHKLMPRGAEDYVAGEPRLAAFGPALSFIRSGGTDRATFPAPLTVSIVRAVATPTTIVMTPSNTALSVSDAMIPAGETSIEVPVSSDTPATYTVTAQLGTTMMMDADVRVLATDEPVMGFTLTPETATVPGGAAFTFTLTLDIPAPPAGAMIDLVEPTGGTIPTEVPFAADELTQTFTYRAPLTVTTGTLTATLRGTSATDTAALTVVPAEPLLKINEVDYDQNSTDTAEYIELFNAGPMLDLAGLQLLLVNGSATPGTVYETIDLADAGASIPEGGYLVVHASGVTVATGALRIPLPGSIQNAGSGAGDGILVWDNNRMEVVDAFAYDEPVSVVYMGQTINLVEGTIEPEIDTSADPRALARIPNGADTDNAAADWSVSTCLTPGAANLMSCP